MTYEVHFQLADAQYTVRGPDIDGVLRLIQGVQGLSAEAGVPKPVIAVIGGWVEWAGGPCPVDSWVWVEIETRKGEKLTRPAFAWRWEHHTRFDDIVRYRVCE